LGLLRAISVARRRSVARDLATTACQAPSGSTSALGAPEQYRRSRHPVTAVRPAAGPGRRDRCCEPCASVCWPIRPAS